MLFNAKYLTNGPVKASTNMLLDKIEIVFIPNTELTLGFVTVIDTDLTGKHKGFKHYWGLLPPDPNDEDVIEIALYGKKWQSHGLQTAFTHHYDKT